MNSIEKLNLESLAWNLVTTESYTSATALAEDIAHESGHLEWLDDPDHGVWDVAVDAFTQYQEQWEK